MESHYSQHIKLNSNDQGPQRFDQKILLYLTFVGMATAFWFLIKLGTDFNAVIKYPITFTNIPGQKVVVNKIPDYLSLSVQATGFNILRYKINSPTEPLVVNMQRFSHQIAKRQVKEYSLLTRTITEEIRNQLPTDIELVSIQPDTIPFVFSIIAEKKIPVKADLKLKFARQYNLDGPISFIPDSVIVNGPDILLDTLKAVFIKKVELNGLKKNIRKGVELEPIDGLTLEQKTVMVQITVSKFTESSVNVAVNSINLPDSLVIRTIPDMVTVRFMVSLNNYGTIQPTDFRAEINVKNFDSQLSQLLPVRIVHSPANIYDIVVKPEQVSYIIERKP